MPTFAGILVLGFFLGMRHATDADHVVAICTITSKENSIKKSTIVGILWGIGHSITVTLVGVPIILYSLVIPESTLRIMEFVVGIMLVILGILNLSKIPDKLTGLISLNIHKHSHIHNLNSHSHFHFHLKQDSAGKHHHLNLFQMLKPLIIGLIHGIAGSAAIALLVLSTISDKILSVFYLFIFHFGVIVGMMLITTMLGLFFSQAIKRITLIHRYLVVGSGITSLIFGIYIMYQNLK